jgi:hypothetical protein
MIETVVFDGVEFAIILRSSFREPGIHFFTPSDFSQQLGRCAAPRFSAFARGSGQAARRNGASSNCLTKTHR